MTSFDGKENGIIEKITLINFMCHSNLELKLGPSINFIVGANGSGKSTILVAITVALGSRATFSNRSKSLGGLIQNGKSFAVVSVTMKNTGIEAWRPDDYGDSIIVERRITSKSSTYKIKSAAGKTIEHNTKELRLIIDHFNIQINNPCCILMQDTSREFLFKNSPTSKYKLFLYATQLEVIRSDLKEVGENNKNIYEILKKKESVVEDLRLRVKELQRQKEELKKIR